MRPLFVLLAAVLAHSVEAAPQDSVVLVETKGAFGDSKLVDGSRVYTTRAGFLETKSFLSDKPPHQFDPPISANWLAAVAGDTDDLVLVASFADRRVRLYRVAPFGKAELISILAETDGHLRIDPTLAIWNGQLVATVTEISGTINNADPGVPNGDYRVRLYRATDSAGWKSIGTVLEGPGNFEDGSLLLDHASGQMLFVCERERIDKGPSSIVFCSSEDDGLNWTAPRTLLDDGADNEPATVTRVDQTLNIIYSSDLGQIGSSYEGSSGYFIQYSLADARVTRIARMPGLGSAILLLSGSVDSAGLARVIGIRSYLKNPALIEARIPVESMLANPD